MQSQGPLGPPAERWQVLKGWRGCQDCPGGAHRAQGSQPLTLQGTGPPPAASPGKLGFTTRGDIELPFSEDLEGAYLLITA